MSHISLRHLRQISPQRSEHLTIGMHVYVQVMLEISLYAVVLSDKACQVVGRSTNMSPPSGASLVTAIANSHLFFCWCFFLHVYGVG